jgi:hypothetical protein
LMRITAPFDSSISVPQLSQTSTVFRATFPPGIFVGIPTVAESTRPPDLVEFATIEAG